MFIGIYIYIYIYIPILKRNPWVIGDDRTPPCFDHHNGTVAQVFIFAKAWAAGITERCLQWWSPSRNQGAIDWTMGKGWPSEDFKRQTFHLCQVRSNKPRLSACLEGSRATELDDPRKIQMNGENLLICMVWSLTPAILSTNRHCSPIVFTKHSVAAWGLPELHGT